jgi:deazaflavin-dependent oxidoreductase (nitroreductase family)
MAATKDRLFRIGTRFHESVFRATNGRVFGKLLGMPVVLLTTTGRKSGQPRTVMLTAPVHDTDWFVIVGSYGGDVKHPAWFLNLRDQPNVEVRVNGAKRLMRARVATSEEKAELWPRVVAAYKPYAGYQRKTERDIPLVILEP